MLSLFRALCLHPRSSLGRCASSIRGAAAGFGCVYCGLCPLFQDLPCQVQEEATAVLSRPCRGQLWCVRADGGLTARRSEGLSVNPLVPLMPTPSAEGGHQAGERRGKGVAAFAFVSSKRRCGCLGHRWRAQRSFAAVAVCQGGPVGKCPLCLGLPCRAKDHRVLEYSRDAIAEPQAAGSTAREDS